jgi:protein-L-isoaspartate(D-aspartate) O-methyltransferase
MQNFAALRDRMIEQQLEARGIKDRRLLDAMRQVPREAFVPARLAEFAHEDAPLPIEANQTISQPYIVAWMVEAAGIAPGDKVLEIGAGSGYAAAVMGLIAGRVISIERHPELADLAAERMKRLGYENVSILHGDGTGGLPTEAPFEAILAAASGSHVPEALTSQLAIRGVLVMPIGEPDSIQRLVKVTRTGESEFVEEDLGAVRFVPLIGAHGWDEKGRRSDLSVRTSGSKPSQS